jgi:hypothetical protein
MWNGLCRRSFGGGASSGEEEAVRCAAAFKAAVFSLRNSYIISLWLIGA